MANPTSPAGLPHSVLVLKGCTRCKGDLVLRSDPFGDYYSCLQCGAEVEPRALSAANGTAEKAA